jgi:hypothetical protein
MTKTKDANATAIILIGGQAAKKSRIYREFKI